MIVLRALVVASLLLAGLAGPGCAPADPVPPAGRTVTDDLGRRVSLPDTIRRVITLAPNLTELVFAAGAGDRLVAASTADDYPPAVERLPRFSALPVDFEFVATLQPQLVLATDQVNNPRDADTFAALGIPTYFFHFGSVDDVLDGLRTVGALLHTADRARRTADSLRARLDRLAAWSAGLPERPRVLFLIGDQTLFAFGAGSYIHTLVEAAGGKSLTAALDTPAPVLSDEFVLTAAPDVIVGAFGTAYDPARLLALHPSWDVVPAVRQGRIYSLDPDLLLRPGPRLVEGAYALARVLHPDRLPSWMRPSSSRP
ncbi:ABC transporter substrate-binding protein [Rhodothermaceae bacterium RA]|nr:ABC transporter substrate-binding protein [Rhodothermaceae bacterium RA]